MTSKTRIAIIGAGLGGCAAASLLQQSGHDVQVYEQAPQFSRLGAGIHVGPNVIKILERMGVADQLIAVGVQPVSWVSRMWDTNEVLFEFPLRGVSQERYGAPYLTVHRGDFHALMLERVDPETVHFGKRLVALDPSRSPVKLTFADGSTVEADIVVGADGLNSVVREILLGPEPPTYTGVVGHRSIFPAHLLGDMKIDDLVKWWAPDRHLIVYYLTNRRDEVYIVTGAPEPEWNSKSSWVDCSKDELRACFEGFHSDALRIIEQSPEQGITKWGFFERAPLPLWSQGSVVLLGDACHPMKPHMAQGAAMAIEDAAALARCLDLVGVENLADTFRRYVAMRRERTSEVQISSRHNTWLRDPSDPGWVFGYDVYAEPIPQAA